MFFLASCACATCSVSCPSHPEQSLCLTQHGTSYPACSHRFMWASTLLIDLSNAGQDHSSIQRTANSFGDFDSSVCVDSLAYAALWDRTSCSDIWHIFVKGLVRCSSHAFSCRAWLLLVPFRFGLVASQVYHWKFEIPAVWL